MAKQKINLKVAGKAYSMVIDVEKEEVYRLAERDINANISRLQKTFGENCDIKDCLAISALQYCINNIAITRQSEVDSDDMKALDTLSQRLDKHLNRLQKSEK